LVEMARTMPPDSFSSVHKKYDANEPFFPPTNKVDVKSIRKAFISFSLLFLIFVTQDCASKPEWNQGMPKLGLVKAPC
jgi:hypothetical protein